MFDGDEAGFRKVTDVNLLGVLFGMAAVAPIMREQGAGSIVNIASVSGRRGHGTIAYVGSKWAVRGMTQSAAHQLGPFGVRANAVLPGAGQHRDVPVAQRRGRRRPPPIPWGDPGHPSEVSAPP